jgi:hypothetical protein
MQWKLVSAFATGAVLASGIVYFAVKPPREVASVAKPPVAKQEAATPVVSKPAVAPKPVAVLPAPVVETPHHIPAPVREKPSPMPPPVRREEPVVIARNDPPPATPPVEPQPTEPAPAPPSPTPQPEAAPPAPAPAPVPLENVSLPPPPPEPPARVPNTVTLAAGTLLPVRIGETLSSARNQPGDSFLATLTQQLVIDGFIIAERGARVEGRVVEASQAGRARGASHLEISIVRLATTDGQNIRIRTEPYTKDGASQVGTDAAKVGGGAAIGAIIGAIAGGGKGAAIGAGAGGAVGAGDVMLTRGKPVEIPVETRISFRVQDPVTITERLD